MDIFILAWLFSATLGKNIPLNVAESIPSLGGSEFNKAYAMVNAMFKKIGLDEEIPDPTKVRPVWKNSDPQTHRRPKVVYSPEGPRRGKNLVLEDIKDTDDHSISKYIGSLFGKDADDPYLNSGSNNAAEDSRKKGAPKKREQFYVKAKDSDFIMIDPLKKGDRNAAAVCKLVTGTTREKVGVASDDRQRDDRGPGPADEDHAGHEDDEAPVRQSRAKESDEEDEEDDEAGPVEGAPVVEEDLDDFVPEAFKTPTVLGVGRLYKVGSAFSVFPVHIPNAPEHIELDTGVPEESSDDEQDEEQDEDEDPMQKELEAGAQALAEAVAEADAHTDADSDADSDAETGTETDADSDAGQDTEDETATESEDDMGLGMTVGSEDLEPHATMSSDQVNLEASASEKEDNADHTTLKKGEDES